MTPFEKYIVAIILRVCRGLYCNMNVQGAHNDMHLQQATGKIPPGWNPSQQKVYSFQHWLIDLRLWQAATDADAARQGPMTAIRLGGAAREMVREMDPQVLSQGRQIQDGAGQLLFQPGLEYLIQLLTARFAPLAQELQLESIHELFTWRRLQGESYDESITRFEIMVFRTANIGQIPLEPPIKTWMLLNALHVPRDRWSVLLAPFLGMLPQNQVQYTAFLEYLRRSGHLHDGTTDRNVRGVHQQYFMGDSTAEDIWTAPSWNTYVSSDVPYTDDDEWSSGHSNPDEAIYVSSEVEALPYDQKGEALYLAYRTHKRAFRSFSRSGPRSKGGGKGRKGKGRSKGKSRSKPMFFADGSPVDEFDDEIPIPFTECYYDSGKGKGKSSSRRNPMGPDGKVMLCSECGSAEHFRRFCPKAGGIGSGKGKGSTSKSSSYPTTLTSSLPSSYPGANSTASIDAPVRIYLAQVIPENTSIIEYSDGSTELLNPPSPKQNETPAKQQFYTFFVFRAFAYAWWGGTAAYHALVRLKNGEGLLVDCGAVGNLCGDQWLQRQTVIAARHGQGVNVEVLAQSTSVEGVGKGSSSIEHKATVPICLSNGHGGTFVTAVVTNSELPALLGLESLERSHALIDCYNHKLITVGNGGYKLQLSPNSTTHDLQKAASGHLLLPCSSWGGEVVVGATYAEVITVAPIVETATKLPVWLINYGKSTVSFSKNQQTTSLTHLNQAICNPFNDEQSLLVLFGRQRLGSKSKHHKSITEVVNKHLHSGGKVLLKSTGKDDVIQTICNWKEFNHYGNNVYANFTIGLQAYVDKFDQVIPLTEAEIKPQIQTVLFELGDHADDEIANESRKRRKAIPIEEHYDDCGDDASGIDVIDTHFACWANDPTIGATIPDNELENFYGNNFLCSYLWGSSAEETEGHYKGVCFATFSEGMSYLQSHCKSRKGYHDYVEIFGGEGGVGRVAIRRGLTGGENYDIRTGFNLLDPKDIKLLIHYLHTYQPRVAIMSPPCTAFGQWARYNKVHAYSAWLKSWEIGRPLAWLAARVARIQLQHGNHFLAENPWQSDIWQLPEWQVLLRDRRTVVAQCDQCWFELQDIEGNLMQKSTAFVASDERLISRLRKRCTHDHTHAWVAGAVGGSSRSKQAQVWPKKLCEAIVAGMLEVLTFPGAEFLNGPGRYGYPVLQAQNCPACKQHVARDDSRHTRTGTCRFPHHTATSYSCPGCIAFKHSSHVSHSREAGVCRYATSRKQGDSRGPRVPAHSIDEAGDEQDAGTTPPQCQLGKWWPVVDDKILQLLKSFMHMDGWHSVEHDQCIVETNATQIRTVEPRFHIGKFPRRSAYGYFADLENSWWQIEANQPATHVRSIGYPIAILVTVFHYFTNPSSSVKFKPDDDRGTPSTSSNPLQSLMDRWEADDEAEEMKWYEDQPLAQADPWTRAPEARRLQQPRNPIIDDGNAEEALPPPLEVEQGVVDPNADAGPIPQPNWSSWDLGTALRNLRSDNKAVVVRTLRKLHLRWWHASADRLAGILEHAGLQKSVIDLVKDVVSTCKVCRVWARPANKAQATLRLSTAFNQTVQMDLLFIDDMTILHLIDEVLRWSAAKAVDDKKPATLLAAMVEMWFQIFGAPEVLISDHEGAILSEESSVFLERWNCNLKPKPVGAHAQIVERHHELIRQTYHRVKSQLIAESLEVIPRQIVSEAVFAHNALVTVHGRTPYVGLLGRTPNLLVEFEEPTVSQVADDRGGASSRHLHRVREIALQQMIEGTAQERVKRAAASQTRPAGELHELSPGDKIDIFRAPKSKDLTGWRGPATVISTNNLEAGYIDAEWSGRVLSVRIADLRKSLAYVVLLDHTNLPLQRLKEHSLGIVDRYETYAIIQTERGWQPSRHASEHPEILRAAIQVGHDTFGIRGIGCRMGHGVNTVPGLIGTEISILMWWPSANAMAYRTITSNGTQALHLRRIIGDDFNAYRWIQFIGCDDDTNHEIARRVPDEPYLGEQPQPSDQHPRPPRPMNVDIPAIPEDEEYIPEDLPMKPIPSGAKSITSNDWDRQTRVWIPEEEKSPVPTGSSDKSDRSRTPIPTVRYPSGAKPKSASIPATPKPMAGKIFPDYKPQRFQQGGSSSSTGPTAPAPAPAPHVPLLPFAEDIPVPESSSSEDEWNDSTGSMPGDEADFLTTYLTRSRPRQREGSKKFRQSFGKVAPNLLDALDNTVLEQTAYLAEHAISPGPYKSRSSTAENDFIEIEIAPYMARLMFDEPLVTIAEDEVVVMYLAKKAPKKGQKLMIEKQFDVLTPAEIKQHWPLVEAGLRKEVASLFENNTFVRQSRRSAVNIMSAKFIHKWKLIDSVRTVKSRMTIRGFQDLAQEGLDTFAGTASRWAQRVVVSCAAQRQWKLFMYDVSVAFLQGLTFAELSHDQGTPEREACFVPPPGTEKYFREMKGLETFSSLNEVFRMVKAIYGLKDAPRAWKLKLEQILRRSGGNPLHTDKNLWTWHKDNALVMLLSTHVDDLKGAGQDNEIERIRLILTREFGKLKEAYDNFCHCGIEHVTDRKAKTITLHQRPYVLQLNLIDNVALMALKPDEVLPQNFIEQYQSLLGALSWLTQTRLDICIYVVALQRASKAPKQEHGLRLNKIVKWVRRKDSSILYKVLENPVRICAISDSAFRKESTSGLAMRGAIICIVDSSFGTDSLGGNHHVLEYYSRKQRRVTRSTFSAELNALSDALDIGRLMALTFSELLRPFPRARDLVLLEEQGKFIIELHAVVDARSVYDALAASEVRPPSEVSLVMMLCAVKEALVCHSLSRLWWCATGDMIADGLNKGAVSRQKLLDFAAQGVWKLELPAVGFTELRHKVITPTVTPFAIPTTSSTSIS